MHRRDFFKTLARLLGLATLPATAKATPPRHHLLQICPLAGFQHHQGETLWPYLTVGDGLELARETDNPFDANAIRIDWNGRQLGYLPRAHNPPAARLMDQGRWLEARIGGLERHVNPWRRVTVEVWMVG